MRKGAGLALKAVTLSVFFFPALSVATKARATDYYVAKTGNDNNPGSVGSPFLTVGKATSRATVPGDNVFVQAGSYPEIIVTSADGASGNPISFVAQGAVTLQSFFIQNTFIVLDGFQFSGDPLTGFAHIEIVEGGSNAVVQNNTIMNSSFDNVHGIQLWPLVSNCLVQNNTIRNILGNGIIVRGTSHTIKNNTLTSLHGYDGIQAFGNLHLITGNLISNSPDTRTDRHDTPSAVRTWGFDEVQSKNIQFTSNTISGFQGQLGFLQQDKSAGVDVSHWQITNNIFYNVPSPFRIEIPSSTIMNNTFVSISNADHAALRLDETLVNLQTEDTADGSIVKNNAFIGCGPTAYVYGGFYSIDPFVQVSSITHNFVAGDASSGFTNKLDWPESNALNGGNPYLTNITDPINGFKPLDISPLCQTKDTTYIGAVSCDCSAPQVSAVIKSTYSQIPGSLDVTLDASGSHSCGQRIVSWAWDFGDGTNGSGPIVTHTFATAGVKTISSLITDDIGNSMSSNTNVTVPYTPPANSSPTVYAGADRSLFYPLETQILLDDATASDDHNPNPPNALTYQWSKVSGGGTATFGTPQSLHTIVTFSGPGTYQLRLTVSDSVLSSTDDVTVSVYQATNTAPSVYAGADRIVVLPATATINDSGVADDGLPNPPGTLTSQWTQISGPPTVTFASPASSHTVVTFPATGIYILQLAASDSVLTTTSTVQITVLDVNSPNSAPVVSAGSTKTLTSLMDQASMNDASVTDDGLPVPPGAVTYQWSQVSGPGVATFTSTTAVNTLVDFTAGGTYILRLSANDGGLSASSDTAVIVPGPAQAPTVSAGANRIIPFPPGQLSLSDASVSAGGSAYVAQWSQVSGPSGVIFASTDSVNTTATFPGIGSYLLRLTAQSQGVTNTSDITVDVVAAVQLTIINGVINIGPGATLTSSLFAPGDVVTITANAPLANQVFDQWTGGTVANAFAASTTLVMPAQNLTLTATYKGAPAVPGQVTDGFEVYTNILRGSNAGSVTINYILEKASHVKLTTYTMQGGEVRTLVDTDQPSGPQSTTWDGRNASGSAVAPGVYLLVLQTDVKSYSSQLVVVK